MLVAAAAVAALFAQEPATRDSTTPAATATSPADATATPRVLFLTHSAGFVHPVVKRAQRALLAHAERCFVDAAGPQLAVEATQDCSALQAAQLSRYQAIMFYTTGELPISDADKAALLAYVRGGGGFVGIHCATDTFYQYPEYGEMIGGYFDGHPWHQDVRLAVEDRTHPTTFHLGAHLDLADEIYQFRDWSRARVHVLLRLTDHGCDLALGKRADRDNALSWCRDYGDGRVFYTALGHRPEVWQDARFLTHLLAGVRWAMDRRGMLARPPAGASVLVDTDGKHTLRARDGGALGWQVREGALVATPHTHDAVSAEPHGDLRVHVEFKVASDEQGGNSGVYLQQRYEVQILDSNGKAAEPRGGGGLYGARAPDFNACLPAGQWQTYDIWFTAARFADGKKTANARVTVVHNGIAVHRDVELQGPTGQGLAESADGKPLMLQQHGSAVSFRNVWTLPCAPAPTGTK